MKALRCFIVDDEIKAIQTLSDMIGRYCPTLIIEGSTTTVEQALKFLSSNPVDILFIDIQMGGETGFDLLGLLPAHNMHIIFVTAYDDYGIQAIKFSATDYLLKPVSPHDLVAAVRKVGDVRAIQRDQIDMLVQSYEYQRYHSQKRIAIPDQQEIRYVSIDNIICCKADNSYTSFYLQNEEKPVVVSKPISEYDMLLSSYGFVRVHQSWLINKSHIESFKKADGGYLLMDNKMTVPVSRLRRHMLKDL